jgi:hypothetical protein
MSQFINSFYNFLKQFESYYYAGIKGKPLPIDSPIYVHRGADDQLYQFLRTTEPNFCTYYILSSSQMGKSSLMIKTASRLRFEGDICTQVGLKILEPPYLMRFYISEFYKKFVKDLRFQVKVSIPS